MDLCPAHPFGLNDTCLDCMAISKKNSEANRRELDALLLKQGKSVAQYENREATHSVYGNDNATRHLRERAEGARERLRDAHKKTLYARPGDSHYEY